MSEEGDFTRLSRTGIPLTITGYGTTGYDEGPYGGTTVIQEVSTQWTPITEPDEDFTFLSRTGQTQVRAGYGLGGFGDGGYGTGDTLSVSINTEVITTWTAFTER